MKKILTVMVAMFCAAACGTKPADAGTYPSDVVATAEGKELKINFYGHGSIGFEYSGYTVYVDPVSDYARYDSLAKADMILVTHEHSDHLDAKAIAALSTPLTVVVGNGASVEQLRSGTVLAHGNEWNFTPADGERREAPIFRVFAMPAYNTSPEKQGFHPAEKLHNGYILDFGGTRVYVAGDGEDTPEMMALTDVDIAFLPVNLPYTMTEEQAARAVLAIRPKIFYPYHYGGTNHKTDLEKLAKLLDGSGIEMRVRPLE